MKKIVVKIILLVLIMLICIGNFCYADVIYPTSGIDVAVEIVGEYSGLVGKFYIIIPLIILYGIGVKLILSRNMGKTKIKKSILLLIPMILLSISLGLFNKNVIENTNEFIICQYVDSNNKILIQDKFDYAGEFINGLAKVGTETSFDFGFHHIREQYEIILYSFIDKNGREIINPVYYELSDFNNEGYAYGIKIDKRVIGNNYFDYEYYNNYLDYYDISYEFDENYKYDRSIRNDILGSYYKIDKNGKEEKITEIEYMKNMDNKIKNTDSSNIKLKKKVKIIRMVKISLVPIIFALVAIIIIKKIIKEQK